MFRQADNHRRTASIRKDNSVIVMCDDGWEEIVDYHTSPFAGEAEARAYLVGCGFEEFDPNADLKAKGFVWNGFCYAKPAASAAA